MENKDIAVTFLKLILAGKIREAFAAYVAPGFKHHNAFTTAGAEELMKGMEENDKAVPNKVFEMKHVVAEGDMVAIHSRMVFSPTDPEFGVMHLFRLEEGKIIELWDVAQQAPKETKNTDGMF